MLGPYEEVDLPVFFYIDPTVNDESTLDTLTEFVLKYTFYFAKKQDLAKVMIEHLKKEKEDQEKLKEKKIELNKTGKNYIIEDNKDKFVALPGLNPLLGEYKEEELQKYLNNLSATPPMPVLENQNLNKSGNEN